MNTPANRSATFERFAADYDSGVWSKQGGVLRLAKIFVFFALF
jgi:hypothetical protein